MKAEEFVAQRYGTRNATIIVARWCRPHPPATLRMRRLLSMQFLQQQAVAAN